MNRRFFLSRAAGLLAVCSALASGEATGQTKAKPKRKLGPGKSKPKARRKPSSRRRKKRRSHSRRLHIDIWLR